MNEKPVSDCFPGVGRLRIFLCVLVDETNTRKMVPYFSHSLKQTVTFHLAPLFPLVFVWHSGVIIQLDFNLKMNIGEVEPFLIFSVVLGSLGEENKGSTVSTNQTI